MSYKKEYLMIPGPTPIPPESARVMGEPMFNHRGEKFARLQEEVIAKAKYVFQTKNDLFLLTCSGTGAMEAALVNFLSPGDTLLALINGNFSNRFAKIAETYNINVQRLEKEWAEPFDYDEIAEILKADTNGRIKAVSMVHNESSTGMMNDMAALSRARGDHPALLIVDTVSSMGAVDLPLDEYGIDVCVTASQKALMTPPGIALISVSDAAWKACEKATTPRFYLDLKMVKKFLGIGQTPFTPAIPQILSLRETLNILIEKEGLVNAYERYRRMAGAVRAGIRGMGLTLLVADEDASVTVTAVKKPEGIEISDLLKEMRLKYGVDIAGGQGKMAKDVFRFGHLGATYELDVIAALSALEMSLIKLGLNIAPGAGLTAAQDYLINNW